MQGPREARTPFARIYEWLSIAEQFVFGDPEVGILRRGKTWGPGGWACRRLSPPQLCLGGRLPAVLCSQPAHNHPRALQKQKAFSAFDFAALRAEVAAVEAAAAALHSPVAFCHNDLLSGVLPYLISGRLVSVGPVEQPGV